MFSFFTLELEKATVQTDTPPYPGRVCSYQFNPHLTRDETITNVLVKALTMFPGPDFSLCLHLLPPNILNPATATDALSDAVRKLTHLNTLLESASYRDFWNTYESDDLYADLVADCAGFEDIMREMIALQTGAVAREIRTDVVMGWLNFGEDDLKAFGERLDWKIEGDVVKLPINRENEAKTTVFRENVHFNRKYPWNCRCLSDTDETTTQSSRALFGERTSSLLKVLPWCLGNSVLGNIMITGWRLGWGKLPASLEG